MFGFSVFWTYLWFAQFMLIWYADIPEETTYFVLRFTEYKSPFLSMLVMNFVFPILLLINSDFKSRPWFVVIGGIVILSRSLCRFIYYDYARNCWRKLEFWNSRN